MDIAVVGIGCRLPGDVDGPDAFWRLLTEGVDAIGELPPDRFDRQEVYDPDPSAPGRIYSPYGGFLDQVDRFDAAFFGIAPREARRMDPQHRLLLEVAWEALEDGGQVPAELAGSRAGVFVGISTHDYGDLHLRPERRDELDAHVNIGNALCAAPNRLSYLLDLRGPSMAIETACSSSLTAVHLACRSLATDDVTLAIAGGVNLLIAPELTVGFCKASMISPDGRCHAFDARANGYVRSEGAGVVVLKPLDAALDAGDPIYAVVRGTAVNEDGRTAGISLPSQDAQEALLRRTLHDADVDPADLDYLEAHGTGTAAGDPIEAGAIGRVVGAAHRPDAPLLIGSAKTNVGHLEAGAGITGFIKTTLMLHHRQVPASLHFERPNPAIDLDGLHLRVPTELQPWPATTGPALAGVNAFGFGGANAHAVLAEAPPRTPIPAEVTPRHHLVAVSGRSPEGLRDAVVRLRDHLRDTPVPLRDLAYTALRRRSHHPHRLAVVARSVDELTEHLDVHLAGEASAAVATGRAPSGPPGPLTFVFAGMGPQWWAMGRQLLDQEPVFARALEDSDRLLRPHCGWSLLDELTADEADSRVDETRVVQVTNCAVQLALAALWRSWGIAPDAVVGHSAGEMAAAHVAGALSQEEALVVAYHRGRLLQRATGYGTMLAAAITAAEADELVAASDARVALAAVNSPDAVTLSGDVHALEAIARDLEAQQRFCRLLPTEVPYHSPWMDPARDELLTSLADLRPPPVATPFASTVTGTWSGNERLDGGYWWRNIRGTVRFADAVATLVAEGHHTFVEIAPHPALKTYLAETAAAHDVAVTTLPSLRRGEDERETMLRSLAALHVRGHDPDLAALAPEGNHVRLPGVAWQRERFWLEERTVGVGREGTDTGHPLLGRRRPAPQPSWTSNLDDRRLGYLDDHVVEDHVVFPGAGYVEMMVAAAKQLDGDDPVVLGDVRFEQLLFPGPDRACTFQLTVDPDAGRAEVHTAPHQDLSTWTRHATASVRAAPGYDVGGPLDLDAIRARCATEPDIEAYHARLEAYGFDYGPTFRGITHLHLGDDEALARIALPDDVALPLGQHHVHPALLDASFQALVTAAAPDTAAPAPSAPVFPVALEEILFDHPPGARFHAHVTVTRHDPDALVGDVVLTDDDGSVAVRCRGLHLKVLDTGDRDRWDELVSTLYELRWEPAPLPGVLRPAEVAPLARVHDQVSSCPAPEDDEEIATYHEVIVPALGRAGLGYTLAALDQLGIALPDDLDGDVDELAARVGVTPERRRLFAALVEIVSDAATPTPPSGRDRGAATGDLTSVEGELDDLVDRLPAFTAEIGLLRLGGRAVGDVLSGAVDPREVLLSADALDLQSRMYHDSPACRGYHRLLADAVEAAVSDRDPGAPLRVLEVGAGSTAATASWLPRLPDDAEVTITDVSAHFLTAARERFGARPRTSFGVLDLERDPGAQGFEVHGFDLVVGANVLHATADLRASLGHVASLLAPGGALAALELCRRSAWYLLVFGLLDGWWRFTDTDVRAQPLLDGAGWRQLCEEVGFARATTPFDDARGGEPLQTLLLAQTPPFEAASQRHLGASAPRVATDQSENHRSEGADPGDDAEPETERPPHWLVLTDRAGVGARLAAQLRASGDACTLVSAEGLATDARPDASDASDGMADGVTNGVAPEQAVVPDDAAALAGLLDDLHAAGRPPDAIVHLWSVDAPQDPTTSALVDAQRRGSESILALAQALDRHDGSEPAIWMVTAGSQDVEGFAGPTDVTASPMWGIGRVLMNELGSTRCRLVDLGPSPDDLEIAGLAATLRHDGPDDELALRGRHRLARRVRGARLGEPVAGTRRHRRDPDSHAFCLRTEAPGTLSGLVLRETAREEPGPGEVAVRVRASGINFRDVLTALGVLPAEELAVYPDPDAIGIECSGVVVACGPGVDRVKVGDEVIALTWRGHGSYVVTPVERVAPKPAGWSFADAAAVPTAFVTADHVLRHVARLEAGDWLLVHVASGALGHAVIRLAQRIGAEIVATAGTTAKRDHLRALGVRHVADSRSLAFVDEVRGATGGRGVDVILNALSGEAMRASLGLLARNGRFVELGKRDLYADTAIGLRVFRENISYTAVDLLGYADDRPDRMRRMMADVVADLADEPTAPLPVTCFDLGRAEEAFRYVSQARHIGKVVLTVDEADYEVAGLEPPLARPDGTYLVTGGLGGFGLQVARWLGEQGAGTLVLVGRSGTPAGGPDALDLVRDTGAEVVVCRADVGDEAELDRVLATIRADHPPLRGVVHAAMVIDDDDLANLDVARFRAVLHPKVAGAWNLHRATREDPIEHFVLFSSLASVLGHPMQGNYAAANAFLDTLAAHRRGLGLPALAIGWGALAEVGYVARHRDIDDYLRRRGFRTYDPQEALELLEALLRRERAHVLAARMHWPEVMAANPVLAVTPRFEGLAAGPSGDDAAAHTSGSVRAALAEAAPGARRAVLVPYLAAHVAAVLGTEEARIERDRALTELGFDSLMAVELVSAIKADLAVRLPVVVVLQGASVEQLADGILSELGPQEPVTPDTASTDEPATTDMAGVTAPSVDARDADAPTGTGQPVAAEPADTRPEPPSTTAPLSPEQRRLWYLHRLRPHDPTYQIPLAVALDGPLDREALQRSLQEVVDRHEQLRVTIDASGEEPVQRIADHLRVELVFDDLSHLPEPERSEQVTARLEATTRAPLDLERDPPWRALLLRRAVEQHVLLLVVHHLACDHHALQLVTQELASAYDRSRQGGASPSAPSAASALLAPPTPSIPPRRYVDHVHEQLATTTEDALAAGLAFWRAELDGERPPLAATHDTPPPAPGPGGHEHLELGPDRSRALEQLARRSGVTPFMVLLASWQTLLHRTTGADEVCVGAPWTTRTPADEDVVGCFVNTVVLLGELCGDPSFEQLLDRTRHRALAAFERADVPFDRVVEAVAPARDAARSPLFETMLVLHATAGAPPRFADLDVDTIEVDGGAAVAELALVLDAGPSYTGSLQYDTARHDPEEVRQLGQRFLRLLDQLLADPTLPLSQHELLDEAERAQILAWSQGPSLDPGPVRTLHDLVAGQAIRTPDAIAVVAPQVSLTYGQLHRGAAELAVHLQRTGVGAGQVVGVAARPGPGAVVAILGVLGAGAAYAPVDPDHPPARLRDQLKDADAVGLVVDDFASASLPTLGVPVLAHVAGVSGEVGVAPAPGAPEGPMAGRSVPASAQPDAECPWPSTDVGADDLAYVLSTSGSTGRPTSVAVTHGAVVNHLRWRQQVTPLDPTDAVLQLARLTFDPSVWELFGPLVAGARVVVPDPGRDPEPARLVAVAAEHDVTVIQAVPSFLDALVDQPGFAHLTTLRHVVCGGEPLHGELVSRFHDRTDAALHHVYGPTEATIEATHEPCRDAVQAHDVAPPSDAGAAGRVPIGRPIANVQAVVLDREGRLCPVGVVGELHLGGAGLARPIHGRSERLAHRFVRNPVPEIPGARLLRTGDLARWRPDGRLVFVGRRDRQVRIRGRRVEPAELETALTAQLGVREAAVVPLGDDDATRRLVAAVVPDDEVAVDPAALAGALADRLPPALRPREIRTVDTLPRTPSGKVDHLALASDLCREPATTPVAPRDDVQRELVTMWEALLPGRRVGVTDDFFDLGGHSLLAMRLVARIRQQWGVEVPVSRLVRARTIEQLALLVETPDAVNSRLVALRPTGIDEPWFLMHPAGGSVLGYDELARHLSSTRPVYALQARGLDGDERPERRVEDLAAAGLAAMRARQPHGPYLLVGWSLGGTIAFELARQLQAAGEEVSVLGLLDPPPPTRTHQSRPAAEAQLLLGVARRLGIEPHALDGVLDDLRARRGDEDAEVAVLLDRVRAAGVPLTGSDLARTRRLASVLAAHVGAGDAYVPECLDIPAVLVEAAPNGAGTSAASGVAAWTSYLDSSSDIRHHRVATDHHGLLGVPHVAEVAGWLEAAVGGRDGRP
jgi:amino acid adenylation domain-containing protein